MIISFGYKMGLHHVRDYLDENLAQRLIGRAAANHNPLERRPDLTPRVYFLTKLSHREI